MEPELHELVGAWPTDNFRTAPSLTAALKPQLTIPITFEYTNGTVGKIFARDDMSTMTLNIYRGILNVLQLNVRDDSVYELQEVRQTALIMCTVHHWKCELTHDNGLTFIRREFRVCARPSTPSTKT